MRSITHRAHGHVVVAVAGLAAIAAALAAPIDDATRAGLWIVGSVALLLGAAHVVWRAGRLRIAAGRVSFRALGRRIDVPRAAARAVEIRRPTLGLVKPTVYALRVDDGGRTRRLVFAEHWLAGRGARRLAVAVAGAVGVPVDDPRGAALRRSRLRAARWLGQGDDWKLLPFVASACALVVWVVVA